MELEMRYSRNSSNVAAGVLTGYSDSNYAEDEDRKSIGGFMFLLAGGAVAWGSRKQDLVAASTTEAEYIAYSEAAKEAYWLRQLCLDMDQQALLHDSAVTLYGDNQPCLVIVKNPEHHGHTKAIDVHFHHVRDLVARGIIQADYIPTQYMLADGLTKPLP